MGFTTEWIRRAITEGVQVRGVTVKLDAEALDVNGRRKYRIHGGPVPNVPRGDQVDASAEGAY